MGDCNGARDKENYYDRRQVYSKKGYEVDKTMDSWEGEYPGICSGPPLSVGSSCRMTCRSENLFTDSRGVWFAVRYPSWLSTENTRKLFITHALVSKVVSFSFISHHFRSLLFRTLTRFFYSYIILFTIKTPCTLHTMHKISDEGLLESPRCPKRRCWGHLRRQDLLFELDSLLEVCQTPFNIIRRCVNMVGRTTPFPFQDVPAIPLTDKRDRRLLMQQANNRSEGICCSCNGQKEFSNRNFGTSNPKILWVRKYRRKFPELEDLPKVVFHLNYT